MRRLLTLSMFASLLVPAGFAQDAPVIAPSSELARTGLAAPLLLSDGYSITGNDTLVTKLLNATVFTATTDDADEIGTITDLVVTPGLGLSAAIISVGGFLGVGAKDVAVDFAQLEWAERPDGSYRWVLPTTAEALSSAPAFIWADSEEVTGTPALTKSEEEAQLVDGNPNAVAVDPDLTTDQPERQDAVSPAADIVDLTDEQMTGVAVYGMDDQQIGTIGDVLRQPDGGIDAVIVDVGGFLGLGAKPVAVAGDSLIFSTDTTDSRYLFLSTTRAQLEAQPVYDPATYSQERDAQRMIVSP